MPELTLAEAEARLRGHGGYGWLLGGRQVWSVAEVVDGFRGMGIPVSRDAVNRWFKAMPHTQDFGGTIGLRATRDDLIIYLASRMRGDGAIESNEHIG